MNLLYRCLRVALALKNVGNRYRCQKRGKVEMGGGGRNEGLEDKRGADEEEVKPSRLEREVVAVTEIVDTCLSSSWYMVFTLWLHKL